MGRLIRMGMSYVLIAKESIDFETKKYNISSVEQGQIEILHDIATTFLKTAKQENVEVQLYLETYIDGDFVEYAKYDEHTDEFVTITTTY